MALRHSLIIEWKLLVEHDLVKQDAGAWAINHDRLLIACWLKHYDTTFDNEEDLLCLELAAQDLLAMV